MSLSVTDNGAALALNGWTDAVTLYKAPGSSSSTVLAVGSKFTVKANALAAYIGTAGTAHIASIDSYTTATGSDGLGNYLDLTLSCTVSLGTSASETIRIRFYDGLPVFDVKVTTAGSWAGFSKRLLALTYPSSAFPWFTVSAPYAFGPTYWALPCSMVDYGDFSSTARSSWTNQLDLSASPLPSGTGAGEFWGLPFVSESGGGIGPYVAFGSGVLYDSCFEYQTATTALSARCNGTGTNPGAAVSPLGGFFVTTDSGYSALNRYALWQQRDYPAGTLPANAVRPFMALAAVNPVTGVNQQPASSFNYTTANISADIASVASAYPNLVGSTKPIRVFEADLAWFDWLGQCAPKSAGGGHYGGDSNGAGLVTAVNGAGFDAWCYMQPYVETQWCAAAGVPSDAYVTATVAGWDATVTHIWDHTTANGRAQIAAMAQRVHDLGFAGCRWDWMSNEPWREFGILYYFRQAIKALDPNFVIECGDGYVQAIGDILDNAGQFGYGAGTNAQWDVMLLHRAKIMALSAPNKSLCCDLLANADDTTVIRPLATVQKQARIMFGYGFPSMGWMDPAVFSGGNPFTDPTVTGYFASYEAIVARNATNPVPTRSIVGNIDTSYSVVQTWADGSTVTYDATADTLTFATNVPADTLTLALAPSASVSADANMTACKLTETMAIPPLLSVFDVAPGVLSPPASVYVIADVLTMTLTAAGSETDDANVIADVLGISGTMLISTWSYFDVAAGVLAFTQDVYVAAQALSMLDSVGGTTQRGDAATVADTLAQTFAEPDTSLSVDANLLAQAFSVLDSLPDVTFSFGIPAAVLADTLSLIEAVNDVGLTSDANLLADGLAQAFSIAGTVAGDANATSDVLAETASMQNPAATSDANLASDVLALAETLGSFTWRVDAILTADLLSVLHAMVDPAITGDAGSTPDVLAILAGIEEATLTFDANLAPDALLVSDVLSQVGFSVEVYHLHLAPGALRTAAPPRGSQHLSYLPVGIPTMKD